MHPGKQRNEAAGAGGNYEALQAGFVMQILILLPLLVHLWLLRKQKNRLLWEGAASLIVFSALLYTGDRQLYAAFLLLIFIMDTAGEYILHIIVPVFILLTWPLSYAPFVWTLMELVLVLYDKLMIRSYEQQLQEYQNKVFDRQVQEVEHMYTTMRAWRHDYHNHLQNLKAKLRKGEVKESLRYLNELEQELDDIRQLVETGNANMDAILNSKLSLALAQGIDINVKASVPKSIPFQDTDMCALLGNLADNAVEACAKVKEQPFLRLYIGLYKGQLYISCTNATSEVVRKLDADYVTRKRGNHGHGLKRMNLIVEKYDGFIQRKNEPGVFSTEIMLPLQESELL